MFRVFHLTGRGFSLSEGGEERQGAGGSIESGGTGSSAMLLEPNPTFISFPKFCGSQCRLIAGLPFPPTGPSEPSICSFQAAPLLFLPSLPPFVSRLKVGGSKPSSRDVIHRRISRQTFMEIGRAAERRGIEARGVVSLTNRSCSYFSLPSALVSRTKGSSFLPLSASPQVWELTFRIDACEFFDSFVHERMRIRVAGFQCHRLIERIVGQQLDSFQERGI